MATRLELDLGGLEDRLGFLLRIAQLEAYDRFFAGALPGNARLTETTLLQIVALNPGVRQGVLARTLRFKRAHMTKIVRGLEEAGLIRSDIPSEDRRSVALWLTEAGKRRVEDGWSEVEQREARVSGALSVAEAAELRRLLRRFLAIPDPVAIQDTTPPREARRA